MLVTHVLQVTTVKELTLLRHSVQVGTFAQLVPSLQQNSHALLGLTPQLAHRMRLAASPVVPASSAHKVVNSNTTVLHGQLARVEAPGMISSSCVLMAHILIQLRHVPFVMWITIAHLERHIP